VFSSQFSFSARNVFSSQFSFPQSRRPAFSFPRRATS
jgi:hypothetical protein